MDLAYFTKNYLIKQLKLVLLTAGIVWIVHTYLLAVPNGGYDEGSTYLTYWLYATGNLLSGFVVWTSIPFIIWFIIFYRSKHGKQKTSDRLTKTPRFFYQQLKTANKQERQVMAIGALVALITILIFQLNGAAGFCLALLLMLLCAFPVGNRLVALVIRVLSSARQLIFKTNPASVEIGMRDVCFFLIGCMLGLFSSLILAGIYWRLGAAVLLLITILTINRKNLFSRSSVFLMFIGSLVMLSYDLLADDGGFLECGNTWKQWILYCPDKITVLLRSALASAIGSTTPAVADAVTDMEEGTPIEDMFDTLNNNNP